ncbi:hypothetical protein MLD38_028456 [Melastoma candidum]|uniref:Uncharacterized protein n=1 Tax=Melastoma candidum TaxID=119954 RepID=A0ACB9N2F1_9MYRT|nr:hypothetical protein MLD38_028456 [Melastoma candidum]
MTTSGQNNPLRELMFVVAILLFLRCNAILGSPDTDIVFIICHRDRTGEGSTYDDAVGEVITKLIRGTFEADGVLYSMATVETSVCYGRGICSLHMDRTDCKNCLRTADTLIQEHCPLTMGATLKLVDCSLRFETYPFND